MQRYIRPGDPVGPEAQAWLEWAQAERYKPGDDPVYLSWHAKPPLRQRLRRLFA